MKATRATYSSNRGCVPQRKRPFTLVEMMVVIVIIAIVIGIAVPSFQKMSSGSAVKAATRVVGAQIRLTRQYAVTKRKKIALIMPTTFTGLDDENCYTAMKPAIVTGTTGAFTFVDWVENTKWTRIPKGAVIAEMDQDEGIANGATSWTEVPTSNNASEIPIDLDKMDDLQESLGSASGSANVRAIVFSPTGRVIGPLTAHCTIAQLAYNSGGWISKNKGTANKADWATPNQYNINVNVFTGRIKINTPEQYTP